MVLNSFVRGSALRAARSVLTSTAPLAGLLALFAGAGLLAGCQSLQSSDSYARFLTPYKIEIVQGNVVTSEQVAAVRPGMTRAQVRDVLGSPLVADPFHGDRWDYVFTIRRQGAESQSRHIVVMFAGDNFKSIDAGSDLPSEREFVASIDTFKTSRISPPLELTPEQLKALPPVKPVAEAASEPVGPVRDYPPLEPRS